MHSSLIPGYWLNFCGICEFITKRYCYYVNYFNQQTINIFVIECEASTIRERERIKELDCKNNLLQGVKIVTGFPVKIYLYCLQGRNV